MSLRSILAEFPEGYFEVIFEGRRYRAGKAGFAGGRSLKFEATELGGTDHVSLNLYRLEDGRELLKPCEMPAEKVERFIRSMRLVAAD
nr:hypothetical protein [uncultured Gellertiella sp.]